jgi:hypothetical protein
LYVKAYLSVKWKRLSRYVGKNPNSVWAALPIPEFLEMIMAAAQKPISIWPVQ